MSYAVNVQRLCSLALALCMLLACATPASAEMPEPAERDEASVKFDYTFEGTLNVDVGKTTPEPLRGVQIRIVRAKGGIVGVGRGVGRKKFLTDEDGRFDVTVKFDRDRDGVGPWHKDIRFRVQARLRNKDLKVRKGGWGKNNWYTIAREHGKAKAPKRMKTKTHFPLGTLTFNDNSEKYALDNKMDGRRAQIWWYYQVALDRLEDEDAGLKKKFVVTYPHKKAFKKKNKGHAGGHAFLGKDDHPGDSDGPRTMMHELMHVWHKQNMRGGATLKCWFDKHHKPLSETGKAARCSGFMEGLAEAGAHALLHDEFGEGWDNVRTHEALRKGNLGYADASNNYPVNNLDEAEHTDVGWENFLSLFWRDDEWQLIGCPASSGDDPDEVGFFRVLEIVKGKTMKVGNQSFKSFASTIENEQRGFQDGDVYQLLGDPSATKNGCSTVRTPLTATTGYQGRVFVRAADGSIGAPISGVEITFTSEDGSTTRTATSGADGSYRLKLPPARYRVAATHPDYQNTEPGGGFFVVDGGEGLQTGNFFLKSSGGGAASANFSGVWDTSFGELRLHQTGGYVIGDYAGNGVMVGKVEGSCVAGVFTNGERNGIFRFNADGSGKFEGQWAWHGDDLGGTWKGTQTTRASASPMQLQNFTRSGSTTQVIDNERTVFDGTYDSSYGPLKLFVRDLFLVGDYADNGILAGMWDGNSFVGRFTNGSRTGWFDLAFSSKNGSFRSGQWGWIGSDGGGDWSLNETSSQTPTPTKMLDHVNCK